MLIFSSVVVCTVFGSGAVWIMMITLTLGGLIRSLGGLCKAHSDRNVIVTLSALLTDALLSGGEQLSWSFHIKNKWWLSNHWWWFTAFSRKCSLSPSVCYLNKVRENSQGERRMWGPWWFAGTSGFEGECPATGLEGGGEVLKRSKALWWEEGDIQPFYCSHQYSWRQRVSFACAMLRLVDSNLGCLFGCFRNTNNK